MWCAPRVLGNHNSLLEKQGLPRISTYPASARFTFGDGRLGDEFGLGSSALE